MADYSYSAHRGMSAGDQLARHARKIPDVPALLFDGRSRSYRALDERVSRLANALRARGVGPGDRVAVLGLNSMEVVEAFLAPTRLAAIGVPINFRLTAGEIAYLLADSGAVAAVVDARFAGVLAEARRQAPGLRTCLVIGGGDSEDGEDYERALRDADTRCDEVVVDEHGAAYIMYTSGTTGRPKGAVLTHYNLLLHAFSVSMHQGMSGDDRVALNGAPLFHVAGLSSYLMCLLPGGTFVITPSGASTRRRRSNSWHGNAFPAVSSSRRNGRRYARSRISPDTICPHCARSRGARPPRRRPCCAP